MNQKTRQETNGNQIAAFIAVVVVGSALWVGGSLVMDGVSKSAADDATAKFTMTEARYKAHPSADAAMDVEHQAAQIARTFLAKNEPNYNFWKDTEAKWHTLALSNFNWERH